MTEALEHTARRIADRGRDALLARLRPAFEEAAAAHADVLELESEQLEEMAQRAADRADGLQWRRALASVATEELGIGLGEALTHPAVERAQEIVGAPSYEERGGPLPEAPGARPEPEAPESEPGADAAEPSPETPAWEPWPDPAEPSPETPAWEPWPDAAEPLGTLRLSAIHLGGIANLPPAEPYVTLRLSEEGLDIVSTADVVLGRLIWSEIRAFDVPPARTRRLRRRHERTRLLIRTEHGDASFEIPAVSPDELREYFAPVLARHALG